MTSDDTARRGGINPYRDPLDGRFTTNGLGAGGHAQMNAAIRGARGRGDQATDLVDVTNPAATVEPLRDEAGRLVPRVRATNASSYARLGEVDQRAVPNLDDADTEADNLRHLGIERLMEEGRAFTQALAAILEQASHNHGIVNTVQRALSNNGYTAAPSVTLRDIRHLFDAGDATDPDLGLDDDTAQCRHAHGAALALFLKRPDLALGLLAGPNTGAWATTRDGLDAELRAINGF